MLHRINQSEVESLSFQTAVLCIDCESISNTPIDECPTCGSRSVHSLSRILGGSLLAYRSAQCDEPTGVNFDVQFTIELKELEGRDLSAMVEGITGIVGPILGRGRASLHINVEPARKVGTREQKAA